MNGTATESRDTFTRSAGTQLIWLGIAATLGFALLMGLLSRASALTGGGSTTLDAIDAESGTITLRIRYEPPQLDSTRATDTLSGMIMGHIMEGLLRYDENNRLAPGVAERWEIREHGATFWLRDDAHWSDGAPVTDAVEAPLGLPDVSVCADTKALSASEQLPTDEAHRLAHCIVAAEGKREIGHTARHMNMGQFLFDPLCRVDEGIAVIIVFSDTGRHGEDIGIENYILWRKRRLLGKQAIRSRTDFELAIG